MLPRVANHESADQLMFYLFFQFQPAAQWFALLAHAFYKPVPGFRYLHQSQSLEALASTQKKYAADVLFLQHVPTTISERFWLLEKHYLLSNVAEHVDAD